MIFEYNQTLINIIMVTSKSIFLAFLLLVNSYNCIEQRKEPIKINPKIVKKEGSQKSIDEINHEAINVDATESVLINVDTLIPKESKKGHILFFHQLGTKSHVFVQNTLVKGLLERGHQVTTVFYVKTNIVHQNYTEIFIKDRYND